MSTRNIDYESMAEVHRLLHEAADRLDESAKAMPTDVHAGPFALEIAKLIAPLSAGTVQAIVRLRLAARDIRVAMENYAQSEYEADLKARNVGTKLEGQ